MQVNEERPQCIYGHRCKSLDPDHWVAFQHTPVEKREEEERQKAEKEARRRAKGKERVTTDDEEEEKLEEKLRKKMEGADRQDEDAWKEMRKRLARERERKMELQEIERERVALETERKRIEFEMSSIRAERKQIEEEESRSRIDIRSREKQMEREMNNRGRIQASKQGADPQGRNNFYKQKLKDFKDKKEVKPQPRARPQNGVQLRAGHKKLPAVPRASSSSSSGASSSSSSSAPSPLTSLPSGPRSRKEIMKQREKEIIAKTKFMAKALQTYKGTEKKHLSFSKGASIRGTFLLQQPFHLSFHFFVDV